MYRMNRPAWQILSLSCLFAGVSAASTLIVDASFNVSVFGNANAAGTRTTYTLHTNGNGGVTTNSFANQPVVLSGAAVPIQMSGGGYITLVQSGASISAASLDVVLNMGSPAVTGTLASGALFFTPQFGGNLVANSLTVTISSGSVHYTQVVPPTSFSIDLFAAGFGSQIQNGLPLSITFNSSDTLSADFSAYAGSAKNGRESFYMSDTRNIGSAFGTHITAYYEVPEPLTMTLVGLGLALLGFRWNKKIR